MVRLPLQRNGGAGGLTLGNNAMIRSALPVLLALSCTIPLAACGGEADTRQSVRAVGSSTVYPFATTVAESFARSNPEFGSPIIEATGTGGGINLFCSGVGANTPDIANASRRMERSEFAACQANGVTEVVELPIGYDGLAMASAQGGITMNLTPEIVYRALAANPYGEPQTARTWRDVDPSLPATPILVYGPPSTSGTRDSFEELVLLPGCDSNPQMQALAESDEARHDEVCTRVRNDGAYVDQGEQDNLIVQKIRGNPNAVGVFGYSYLQQNAEALQGLPINGVLPTFETISSEEYPGARSMYLYIKKAHLDAIPGLRQLIGHWVETMQQEGGPLAQRGHIGNQAAGMARARLVAEQFPTITAADLTH